MRLSIPLLGLAAASLLASSVHADITSGLVGYWTVDTANISGATALDTSGNGNNASLLGSPQPALATGKIAQAGNLVNTSQSISAPDRASLNLTGPFTVSAWVNFTVLPTASQYPNVVAKLSSPASYYGYGIFWNGSGVSAIIGPGAAKWYITSPYRPTVGVWNHYVSIFDGTNLKSYVNGALYSQVAATAPGTTATIPVKMGPHYSNPSSYGVINGMLDDVRIYNRALTASDVTQLYGYAGSGCTYALSATTGSFTSTGGPGSVGVTAGTSCSWTASSSATWITISAGSSGSGNGTVTYSVAANTSTSSRTGTMTIAGKTFNVSQAAASGCTYAISPGNAAYASTAGNGSVSVTAGSSCTWSASSAASWITITAGASGSGNGTVSYSVAANTSSSSRTGSMTIAGQTFSVTQNGVCSYAITPTSASLASGGGSGSISVTAGAGCTWITTSSASWITITSGSTGTGNGTVNYSVAANTSTSTRSGTVTVAGNHSCTISQAAATLIGDTTPPSVSLTAPTSGSTVAGTATLSASASDNVGVSKVEFYCDNTVLVGTATASPFSASWNSAAAANGSHTLCARAYDAAGNWTTSASRSVTVNNGTTTTAGQLQWAKAGVVATTYGQARTLGVATDSSGNVAAAGDFSYTANFGNGTLTSAGGRDGFIVKYNSQGAVQWARRFGTWIDSEAARAVAFDSAGNVIVAGCFAGAVDFGGVTLTSPTSPTAGYYLNIFVAKYSPAGVLQWAKSFGGTGYDLGRCLAVDIRINPTTGRPYDDIFLGATIQSPNASFGSLTLASAGGEDIVLAKLSDADGRVQWAKRFGGTGFDQPHGLAIDAAGSLLVAGTFGAAINLGGGVVNSTAGSGGFVANYSAADGTYRWADLIGSTSSASANSVAVDPNTGNVIVGGTLAGPFNFGTATTASGGIFLAAYNSAGANLWGKTFNTSIIPANSNDSGNAVEVDASGNIAFCGAVTASINFGGGWLSAANNGSFFVAGFNSAGAYRWAKRAGGSGGSAGYALSVDTQGHLVGGGSIGGTTDFGGISLTTTSPTLAPVVVQYGN